MGDQSARLNTASLAAFVLLVAALVALAYRHSLFATHISGIVLQVLAVLLMLWARLTLKSRSFHATASPTEGDLITTGPYRFIRRPIYAAIFYFVVSGVAFHISAVNVALILLAVVGIAVRIGAEEYLLTKQYPEYSAYAARTKRVVPFVL